MIVFEIGESHFGMYSVGEAVSIDCVDTTGSANLVQWLDSTGTVLTFGSASVTLTISLIADTHHGLEYTCRIHSSSAVTQDSSYTIIVLSELALVKQISASM